MVTALIVDDEQHQQELLTGMLEKHFPQIDVKHICSSVDEGIQKIEEYRPELVFLDVMLPPKTGFDLLSNFKKIDFDIIFTTSHEQFALQAIKLSAIDYLLKPYGLDDLRAALEKFEIRKEQKQSGQHIQALLHNLNAGSSENIKIALPTMAGFVFVPVSEIIRCEADNVYTTVHFTNRSSLVVSKSIKECENILCAYNFFRPHSSHLINMRFIKEYIKGDRGLIKMSDGSSVELARMRRDDFMKLLNKI